MKRKVTETIEPTKKFLPPTFNTAPLLSPSYKPIFHNQSTTQPKPPKLSEIPPPLSEFKIEPKSHIKQESSSLAALLDELQNGPKSPESESQLKCPSPTIIKSSKEYINLCEYLIELNIGNQEYGECKLQIVQIDQSKYFLIRNTIGKILFRLPLLSKPKLQDIDSIITLSIYDKEGSIDKELSIKILTSGDKSDQTKELQDAMMI